MNNSSNGKKDDSSGWIINGSDLAHLLAEFEICQSMLRRAIKDDDQTQVVQHDERIVRLFDQILNFPIQNIEDRILLVEFLLDQLQLEFPAGDERIRSRIIDLVKRSGRS